MVANAMEHRFLILLPYYDRPKMVRNALKSVAESTYQNYELWIIDDGSHKHFDSKTIIEIFGSWNDNIHIERLPDTPQSKMQRGGSRHGEI